MLYNLEGVILMSQTLTLPDDLVEQLRRVADQQGVAVEQLLTQWVEAMPIGDEKTADVTSDDELLITCTRALIEGSEPPVAADWDEIMAALRCSEPVYSTVEEAMNALRNRHWVKDE